MKNQRVMKGRPSKSGPGGERLRQQQRRKEEENRRRSVGGGEPNELGVTQGQNGEQGNTIREEQTRPPGKLSH